MEPVYESMSLVTRMNQDSPLPFQDQRRLSFDVQSLLSLGQGGNWEPAP